MHIHSTVNFPYPAFSELVEISNERLVRDVFNHWAVFWFYTVDALSCIRVFLLYYDHQYGKVLSTTKWKIVLNAEIRTRDWYLQNRRTYGNDSREII